MAIRVSQGAAFMTALTAAVILLAAASARGAAEASAAKEAKLHFKNGLTLFEEKAYEKAIVEFKEAYRLYPFDKILYNIALCYDNMHAYSEAMSYYMSYLATADKIPAKTKKAISKRLDELGNYVGLLEVSSSEPAAEIVVDGKVVGQTPVTSITIEVGEHEIVVRKKGFVPFYQRVTVVSGSTTSVVATLSWEETPVVTVEKEDSKRILHPAIFYASAGLLVVTALTALSTGVLAVKADRKIGEMYDDEPWDEWSDRRHRLAVTADVMIGLSVFFAATTLTISFFTRFKKTGKEQRTFLAPELVQGGGGIRWGVSF
jgi:tetratricopeptide (TPR) repeat protein